MEVMLKLHEQLYLFNLNVFTEKNIFLYFCLPAVLPPKRLAIARKHWVGLTYFSSFVYGLVPLLSRVCQQLLKMLPCCSRKHCFYQQTYSSEWDVRYSSLRLSSIYRQILPPLAKSGFKQFSFHWWFSFCELIKVC